MFFIIKKNIFFCIFTEDQNCPTWSSVLTNIPPVHWRPTLVRPVSTPVRLSTTVVLAWYRRLPWQYRSTLSPSPAVLNLRNKKIISENYQKIKAVCHQPLRKLEKWSHHFELEVGGTFQKVRPDSGCTDLKVIVKDERIVHNRNMYHLSCFREWFI